MGDSMDILRRVVGHPQPQQVEGILGYYGLSEWWLSTFSPAERQHIDATFQPMGGTPHALTQGRIGAIDMPASQFLSVLASWFNKREDHDIGRRIRQKVDELAQRNPIKKPGYYNGRHYSTYVEEIRDLKRSADDTKLEALLSALVDATEAEDQTQQQGVAPAYYEELAILYRKRHDVTSERAILERFAAQRHAPGVTPAKLLERLAKVQQR
jgi:hypothetical protein